MFKEEALDKLTATVTGVISDQGLNSARVIEAVAQIVWFRTTLGGGTINAKAMFARCLSVSTWLTELFSTVSEVVPGVEERGRVFTFFTMGFNGQKVRKGTA